MSSDDLFDVMGSTCDFPPKPDGLIAFYVYPHALIFYVSEDRFDYRFAVPVVFFEAIGAALF